MSLSDRHLTRLGRLRSAMAEAGVGACLLTPSGDMEFVTGLKRGRQEPVETHRYGDYLQGVLVTPDRIVTIVPHLAHLSVDPQLPKLPWLAEEVLHLPDGVDEPAEALALFAGLQRAGAVIALPKFGLAMTVTKLQALFPGLRFTSTEDLVSPMRMVKDPDDLQDMERAAAAADQAFRNVVAKLHLGIHEAEVYQELDWQARVLGTDGTSFTTSLLMGRPGLPAAAPSPQGPLGQQFLPGWVLAFDFGFICNGWCSDFGRTVYFGQPTPQMAEAHFLVAEAQRRAFEIMAGGQATCAQVDAAARGFLEAAGRGQEFIHRLGHSIGMDVHEHPFLIHTDQTMIQNGMTFTVEPSLWVGHEYFVRVEDVVLVTPEGGRSLNAIPTFDMTVIE